MSPQSEYELLNYWFQGNPYAMNLASDLIAISQIWDDLIDRDNPVSAAEINQMMMKAILLPKNPFYRQHQNELLPILEDRLFTWLDANRLEQIGTARVLEVSYIIRSVITDIVIHIAYLIGGFEWRQQAAEAIRLAIYIDNEPFGVYLAEHQTMEDEKSDVFLQS